MRTAVLGGGITGLTLAHFLSGKRPVTLYERCGQVGGLAGAFRLDRTRLDKFFHHIFLSDRSVRELLKETDLDNDVIWRPSSMGYFSRNNLYPFTRPWDLLRFSALSFNDRLRFGFGILRSGRIKQGRSLDRITAKRWVEESWGGEIYARFWKPLLQCKFGTQADEISAAWLWGRIHARANSRSRGQEQLGYLKGGFVRLLERLLEINQERGVQTRLREEVFHLARSSQGKWMVQSRSGSESFDQVVLALPSPTILEIAPEIPEEEKNLHASIDYQAIRCMVLVMRESLSPVYWLNVNDPEIAYSGVVEQTRLVPRETYGGFHLAYLFNYLEAGHPWLKDSPSQLFARYEPGLKKMFPHYRREQVVRKMLFRDAYATPVYRVGHLNRRPPIASKLPGLFYANTAQVFPDDRNLNFSIELAHRVANEIQSRV